MNEPLVSIVTPVYNGARYLAECIESILNQTYQNWEYIIVNNCSTDDTEAIASQYANKDSRVRVHTSTEFRDIMPNWNYALRQMSESSKYCKVIHADDLLYPECIERMTRLMEENPSVDIVSSFRLNGLRVDCDGVPFDKSVLSGREVCRATFYKKYYLFGSPSTVMIRSSAIRKRDTFYTESNYHADVEACFDVLQDSDFGFIHQVLSYTRLHDETQSATRSQRLKTNLVENSLGILKKFGPAYLDEEELSERMDAALKRYYNQLALSALKLTRGEFWDYHKMALAEIGLEFSYARLFMSVLKLIVNYVLHPVESFGSISKRIKKLL